MKRILWLWLSAFLLSFCISFGNQTILFDLPRFHYEEGIILYGVHSETAIYIPEKTVTDISDFYVQFRYAYTELAGAETTITFLLNGLPIATRVLSKKSGMIRVDFPAERIPAEVGISCSVIVTLDYSECDRKPLAKEALWFRIFPETTFYVTGLPVSPKTISDFFLASGIWSPLELSFKEFTSETFRSIAQTSLLSGHYSKSIKKSLVINTNDTDGTPSVIFREESALTLEDQSLFVGNHAVSLLRSDLFPSLIFRRIENPVIDSAHHQKKKITLRELGLTEETIETVYTSENIVGFAIDVFNGVPETAVLSINISVLHILEDEALTCAIFLNDELIGSLAFDSIRSSQKAKMRIPEDAFRSYNVLRFEIKKFRGNCKSVSVSIHGDSEIEWSSIKSLNDLRFADFPYSLYGKTGIVVSSLTEETASLLLKIMYLKGEGTVTTPLVELITAEEWENNANILADCDSYLFIVDEEDIVKLTDDINIADGLQIINKDTGKVFYSIEKEASFIIGYTWIFREKPAILWSVRGEQMLFRILNNDQWKRIKTAPGNTVIIDGNGQVATFLIGKEHIVPDLQIVDERFQFLFRIGIVLSVAFLVVLFLIFSYRRTSSKR
jgi:hypothetical protein